MRCKLDGRGDLYALVMSALASAPRQRGNVCDREVREEAIRNGRIRKRSLVGNLHHLDTPTPISLDEHRPMFRDRDVPSNRRHLSELPVGTQC